MSTIAFIRRCQEAGIDLATALKAAEAFEAEVQIAVDAVLEPRRAKDRERKRIPRKSVDSAEFQEKTETLSLPPSPQTPQPPTQTRVSITSREASAREEAAFGRFWLAYPRKTAKADARKAFTRAWRKLGDPDAETMLIGALERAKAAWVDAQFIPHASTWLNGERWSDEIEPPTPRAPNGKRPHTDHRLDAFRDKLHDVGAAMDAAFQQPRRGH